MNPRNFDNPEHAARWSKLGGVSLYLGDADTPPYLQSQHEPGWMYYWAGKAGARFVDTKERGKPGQRIELDDKQLTAALAFSPPGWSDVSTVPTVVLFTGTRHGMTESQRDAVRCFLFGRNVVSAHHGLCIGADHEFHKLLELYRVDNNNLPWITGWPASVPEYLTVRDLCTCDDLKPERPPLVRNTDMMAHGKQIQVHAAKKSSAKEVCVLACPVQDVMTARGGTWHAIREAKKQGLLIFLVSTSGDISCTT